MLETQIHPSTGSRERGFTLVELLVSMAITMVVLGATMAAMNDAIKATDSAALLTGMNNGLRSSMDLMVRDLLQVGQGLPSGRVIQIPSGTLSQAIRLPGPPGTNFQFAAGSTEIPAVVTEPRLGPVVNGVATDVITTLAADSAFDQVRLTALAADGSSMTVDPAVSLTGGGASDIRPGDLIMLSKQSVSALAQVTRVVGQQVFFDANDSLNLNQTAAAAGTVSVLQATAPADTPPVAPATFVTTQASRIRMISYYIDATTDAQRPRLIRRMNNGDPLTFNNNLGTAVAFDMEGLAITYDLVNGTTNPTNANMDGTDVTGGGGGACAPAACSRNEIRTVNILLSGRSRVPLRLTRQFLRNRLQTQVSLRSLAFVDRYR
jgi:prepilin-type N-terminal cleavage/methylation domain-containing protein